MPYMAEHQRNNIINNYPFYYLKSFNSAPNKHDTLTQIIIMDIHI